MDGDDIKVFYGTQLALQQLRKKEPGLTRPDGMTLTRIGYVAAIVNMERHKVGRTLMKLAEFGNGFLNRHMVPRRENLTKDVYLDIDETMRPISFVVRPDPDKEDHRDYQPRKPKKMEHCHTPGCPCSAVQEIKSTVLVCVDCGDEIKCKVKKTIIRNPIPYPDELDEQEPAIEDQVTEPLPVVTLPRQIVPLACRSLVLHRDLWIDRGSGAHCPVCEPAFAI